MLEEVLSGFGFKEDNYIIPFGNGLINNTWLVNKNNSDDKFILQRINQNVFKSPEDIAFNIRIIYDYLKKYNPEYFFVAPLQNMDGRDLVKTNDGYFRIFPFVKHSHTIDVVQKPQQAYEAANQFANFTKKLSGINTSQLKITLPDFHNLHFRFKHFEKALKNGDKKRMEQSKELINFIYEYENVVDEFKRIQTNNEFRIRVTHHDTKISNVLFDENDKGLCVIDLDTVMPGYFISDVGDMMRTYLSPVSEEEKDFLRIEIREDFYNAIVNGYLDEINMELHETEKKYFIYAGKFMIYMQALRFLTDFINNDIYYGAKYEEHNFVRAGNQVTLFKRLLEFEEAHKN